MNITDDNMKNTGAESGFSLFSAKTLKKFFFGVLTGLICFLVLMLASSLLMTISSIPDWLSDYLVYIIIAVSSIVAGFVSVRLIGTGGILNGFITGVFLFLVHIIASIIFGEGSLSLMLIAAAAIELIFAALGGIMAVNLK